MAGQIPATPADGNMKVVVVPTLADADAPTVAELNAETAVDISCYLTAGGYQPSQDQATITDERLCSTQVFGSPGRKTLGLSLQVVDNTNSEYEEDYNEAVEVLAEGQDVYVVERRGVPFDVPFAAGQTVRVWPIKAGMKQNDPPEANSVLRATIPTFVTANVVDVVTVA